MNNKRTNLVTGGAGFIGSHLIEQIIRNNENVICLDNFSTGTRSNIKKWENDPRFKIIEEDVLQPLKNIKVERIWHLACPASPCKYQSNPIETSKIIFQGTLNMLELAKKNNCELLFASSSEIYGNPKKHPQIENYLGNVNTCGLRSCYEEGKRIGETLCNDFRRIHKINTKIIRIFNTYGPNMLIKDGRVISNFISQALLGEDLTIYGYGNQTRSFCYIDDLINGMLLFMNSNYNGPLNIGNTEEISINELADMIIRKINSSLKKTYQDYLLDEPFKRKPSILKAKEVINWEPSISLNMGLDNTINDFKKRIQILTS